MSKIKFSLIASTILVLSSFVPVIQVLLLLLNSFAVKPISWILNLKNDNVLIYGFNGAISILMFLLFCFSSNLISKLLSLLGILMFFIPFLFYATENIISTEKYYFLHFLIIGIITGLLLLLLEIIKNKALK